MIDNKTNFEEYFETYGLLGISPRLATELAQQKDYMEGYLEKLELRVEYEGVEL